jgi:hypothetical protein
MMSDRELLELAAKAAGYDPARVTDDGVVLMRGIRVNWKPLDDDGDALKLAVVLNIGIRSHGPDHWQQPNTSVALYDIGEHGGGRVTVPHGNNPSAATRRAIVRAASEIGKATS